MLVLVLGLTVPATAFFAWYFAALYREVNGAAQARLNILADNVASNLDDMGWVTYTTKGDMVMTWDFGAHGGDLTISKFDTQHIDGGLTFTGHMTAPGEVGFNQFGGTLSGKDLPDNLSDLSGSANGSFVRGPDNFRDGKPNSKSVPQGVIGNWTVDSGRYTAGGIFGGSHNK
jgi:hypothetical protein